VDVLKAAGFDDMRDYSPVQHVLFEGLDTSPSGSHYYVSTPIQKAVDQYGDFLLACEMNGEDLTPFHG
jgi:sulfite oxidase